MDLLGYSLFIAIFRCLLPARAHEQNPGRDSFETFVGNGYDFLAEKIDILSDLNQKEKQELQSVLEKKTQKIIENKKRASAQKYKKRRVQFTPITDAISENQRFFTQMESVIAQFNSKIKG